MGGSSSTPKLNKKIMGNEKDAPDVLIMPIMEEAEPMPTLKSDLNIILKVIDAIPPSNPCYLISCFAPFTVPLVNYEIKFDDSDFSMKFASIALARIDLGRILCFSNIETLTKCVPSSHKYTLFVQKVLRWIGGPQPITRMLCLYKIDEKYQQVLKTNLEGLGFGIEITDSIENMFKYTIVIVQSNCESDPMFFDFISKGGGFVVLCVENEEVKINETLKRTGICILENNQNLVKLKEEDNEEDIVPDKIYETLKDGTLENHVSVFKNVLSDRKGSAEMITNLSKIILKEVICSSDFSYKYTTDIMSHVISMISNDINVVGTFGNDELSVMLYKIAEKIYTYIPETFWSDIDFSRNFIGFSFNAECEEMTIKGTFNDSGWYDTKIWVQPGYSSTITFDKRVPDCDIIIGSHNFLCSENKPPWKRVPFASVRYHVNDKTMTVTTPYGGMVFFAPCESELTEGKRKAFSATFSDACSFPIASLKTLDQWKQEYAIEIPWGEVVTKYTSFVTKKTFIDSVPQLAEQINFIDAFMGKIFEVSDYEFSFKFRFSFDVEYPTGLRTMYPITIGEEFGECTFLKREPSSKLFEFITLVAFNTFHDEGFSYAVHSSVAVAICHLVFTDLYKVGETDQYNSFNDEKSLLLIDIAKKNRKLFSKAISELRKAQNSKSLDCDKAFISILEEDGGFDLSVFNKVEEEVEEETHEIEENNNEELEKNEEEETKEI